MIKLNENVMTDEEIEAEKAQLAIENSNKRKERFEYYVKQFGSTKCGSRLIGKPHYLKRSDFHKGTIACAFCGQCAKDHAGETVYEVF